MTAARDPERVLRNLIEEGPTTAVGTLIPRGPIRAVRT